MSNRQPKHLATSKTPQFHVRLRTTAPRHIAPASAVSWRATMYGRFARTATAAAMVGLLALPTSAFAATSVTVDGTSYDAAHTEETWNWDGGNNMGLNGYDGGAISAEGEGGLSITLTDDNSIADSCIGILVQDGDLSIGGDGTLDIASYDDYGVETKNGDITLDGVDVNIESYRCGLHVNGSDNITINDSNVAIKCYKDFGAIHAGHQSGVSGEGQIVITGSTVSASNTDYCGIWNESYSAEVGVIIKDSTVTAKGRDFGIYSESPILIDNSGIEASGVRAIAVHLGDDIQMDKVTLDDGEKPETHEVGEDGLNGYFTDLGRNKWECVKATDGSDSKIILKPVTDTPTPDPEPTPDPDPTPDPEPDPTPTPDPEPTPEPTPTPDPEPTPDPTPTPEPAPDPTPAPEPAPAPEPQQETATATQAASAAPAASSKLPATGDPLSLASAAAAAVGAAALAVAWRKPARGKHARR